MTYPYVYPFYDEPSFLYEVWILYGIGMLVLVIRLAIRLKTVGIRGYQWDDFFFLLVVAMYTADAGTVHIIYFAGSNVEASTLATERPLTPAEIAQFEYGSKNQLVAWYTYTALIWCLKATMLCFLSRMTYGTWHNKMVTRVSTFTAVCYLPVMFTITFSCYPTHLNWQVEPNPGAKCTLKPQNFIVTTVFNVLTDAMVLSIPVAMLWNLRLSMRKKIVIGILLSSGVFMITAALIRVVLTLGNSPSALNINRWGVRETIVGIIAVNTPVLRPIVSKSFWSGNMPKPPVKTRRVNGVIQSTTVSGPCEMISSISGGGDNNHGVHEDKRPGGSQNNSGNHTDATEGSVVVRRTIEVTSEAAESSNAGRDSGYLGLKGDDSQASKDRADDAV